MAMMASNQGSSSWLRRTLGLSLVGLHCLVTVHAADDCAPIYWQPGQFEKRGAALTTGSDSSATITSPPVGSDSSSATLATTTAVVISPLVASDGVAPGEVNCRYTTNTRDMDLNYYTCTTLATKYGISVEDFFMLNPTVEKDCSNLEPDTDYCVDGFIEPVRATGGLCGPANGGATCLGTDFQCCNANTFKCGNTTADCAPGTCYEGACPGDSVYTTDGKCGAQHGYKQCAGVWGDCCNADGQCGTGEDFCGYGNCQLGNCTVPSNSPSPPSWLNGNTTDGTCGGPDNLTCNVVFGNCCNKDGLCGALASDCGAGCQPRYGNCSTTAIPSSSTSRSSTSRSTTAIPTTSSSTTRLSTTASRTTSTPTRTTQAPTTSLPPFTSLPQCGQTCFNNVQGQYQELGCPSPDAYCLCDNVNFGYGLRDCANAACANTAVASTVISYGSQYCANAVATHVPTATGIGALPSCGQTCFKNLQAQYAELGCPSSSDAYCLCGNADFGYGLRDCANGACGTAVGSTVIAYGSQYCSEATATHVPTGVADLPACGQTCFNNLQGQYAELGCSSPSDSYCLCGNVNFGYGLRDCANGACGTAVGSTVIAYGSTYCAQATATHRP